MGFLNNCLVSGEAVAFTAQYAALERLTAK